MFCRRNRKINNFINTNGWRLFDNWTIWQQSVSKVDVLYNCTSFMVQTIMQFQPTKLMATRRTSIVISMIVIILQLIFFGIYEENNMLFFLNVLIVFESVKKNFCYFSYFFFFFFFVFSVFCFCFYCLFFLHFLTSCHI